MLAQVAAPLLVSIQPELLRVLLIKFNSSYRPCSDIDILYVLRRVRKRDDWSLKIDGHWFLTGVGQVLSVPFSSKLKTVFNFFFTLK